MLKLFFFTKNAFYIGAKFVVLIVLIVFFDVFLYFLLGLIYDEKGD